MPDTKRKAPAANEGNSETQLGNRSTASLPAPRVYPARIVLSDGGETFMGDLTVDVYLGRVGLHQLSPGLLAFFTFSYEQGRDSRNAEVTRLEYERDLWYFCANNKGKRPADFMRAQTDTLWAQAVNS
jgi:hypothetical protein